MRHDESITLIGTTFSKDTDGNTTEIEVRRPVLAGKKSVRQSEFYQAAASGLVPELVFVIWTGEYNGESKLEYNGKMYYVVRMYEPPKSRETEIICSSILREPRFTT